MRTIRRHAACSECGSVRIDADEELDVMDSDEPSVERSRDGAAAPACALVERFLADSRQHLGL